jgi:hypothetical protein
MLNAPASAAGMIPEPVAPGKFRDADYGTAFGTARGPCSGAPVAVPGGCHKGAFSGVRGEASAAPLEERRRGSPTL